MDIREKCQPHLWLLTGTGEGHVFAESLLKEGWKITVSVVSDRASIPYEKLNLEKISTGELITEEEIRGVILNAIIQHNGFHCVVDLTHPFATKITRSISKVIVFYLDGYKAKMPATSLVVNRNKRRSCFC